MTAPSAPPSLFDVPSERQRRTRSRRRVLTTEPVAPVPTEYHALTQWVEALVAEHAKAYLSALRTKCYAAKPTTSRPEMGQQVELRNTHLIRQHRVVLALVEAIRSGRCP